MTQRPEAETSAANHRRRVALVPLNGLAGVKTRLRGVLNPADRAALVLQLAERVFAALSDSGVVARIGMVSPEARTLAQLRESGVGEARKPRIVALPTDGLSLNADLEQGRAWALAQGATEILVVLADLPLLTAEAVRRMIDPGMIDPGMIDPGMIDLGQSECATSTGTVVLGCDRKERGTNAMLLRPGDAIPFAFGQGSLARHVALARSVGIEPLIFASEETSFDVDTPADLHELIARGLWMPSDTSASDTSRRAVAG